MAACSQPFPQTGVHPLTLTAKAGPPQASCWDLEALVLRLSAGPSLEGLDQKEVGGAWTQRLRGGLRPLSQVPREQSRARGLCRGGPGGLLRGGDARLWLYKVTVISPGLMQQVSQEKELHEQILEATWV